MRQRDWDGLVEGMDKPEADELAGQLAELGLWFDNHAGMVRAAKWLLEAAKRIEWLWVRQHALDEEMTEAEARQGAIEATAFLRTQANIERNRRMLDEHIAQHGPGSWSPTDEVARIPLDDNDGPEAA